MIGHGANAALAAEYHKSFYANPDAREAHITFRGDWLACAPIGFLLRPYAEIYDWTKSTSTARFVTIIYLKEQPVRLAINSVSL